MEAFSGASLLFANAIGFIAIVVFPWFTHLTGRHERASLYDISFMFFLVTVAMWFITPIAGMLFAADTPGYTRLEVGQYVMAFLLLYFTGGVMGFLSLMVHYSVLDRLATKPSRKPA